MPDVIKWLVIPKLKVIPADMSLRERHRVMVEVAPSLHVSLSMFACGRVVEFERSQTSSSHQQEGDVLDIFRLFLVGVLSDIRQGFDLNICKVPTLKILRISELLTTENTSVS